MTEKSEYSDSAYDDFSPHGVIAVNKPPGPSSYDVIRIIKKSCALPRKWKIGHLGTLDPFASGVLVVALGKAVRYSQYFLHVEKSYRARLILGSETDTLDPTGSIVKTDDIPPNWKEIVHKIVGNFRGEISQIPPSFSAKQIDGVRAYKKARKGESPDLKPISVTIYSIGVSQIGDNWFDFECDVSSGTYIRSLGRDIANALGTCGHLAGLTRLRAGNFLIHQSIPLKEIETNGRTALLANLKGIEPLINHLHPITVSEICFDKILNGVKLNRHDINSELPLNASVDSVFRIMSDSGEFISLGKSSDEGTIIPFKQWVTDDI